ncbi:hypothetical protein AAK967_02300 [Atopobiaceae bacterium 24-176]
MVDEFCGRRCRLCGGDRYAAYTVVRESPSTGLLYEARAVCRSCGNVAARASDEDEGRAVRQVRRVLA